jgi:hypothetical protein
MAQSPPLLSKRTAPLIAQGCHESLVERRRPWWVIDSSVGVNVDHTALYLSLCDRCNATGAKTNVTIEMDNKKFGTETKLKVVPELRSDCRRVSRAVRRRAT